MLQLDRLDEAQGVLENCLVIYRSAGLVADEAQCLSALAAVWSRRGELDQAIALERQTLAVRNMLPDPANRAISHQNLSNYLQRAEQPTAAASHQLAAGVYKLVVGLRDSLALWRHNLGIDARQALASGQRYTLPRLEDVLAQPAFAALRQFLDSRGVDRAALQARIDQLVDDAHAQAVAAADPLAGLPPEAVQVLRPIVAAATAGQDVEPLLAALRQQRIEAGVDAPDR